MKRDPWAIQRWAFERRVGNPTRKLVLQALAMMAESNTGYCFAAQEDLAEYAECSIKSVYNHLKVLEEQQLIARRRRVSPAGNRIADGFLVMIDGGECWPSTDPRLTANSAGRPTGKSEGVLPATAVAEQERPKNDLDLKRGGASTSKPMTYRGKRVDVVVADNARLLLGDFNEAAGRKLGQTHVRQVVGALLENPDVDLNLWRTAVRNTVSNPPGWAKDRQLQLGDIFGERAVQHALSNRGAKTQGATSSADAFIQAQEARNAA